MFSTFTRPLLIVAVGLVTLVKADEYANFFDDAHCSVNGGIGVSINNPGCLSEGGRGSVYIPAGPDVGRTYCLVTTHGDGSCSCQSSVFQFTATGFCFPLNPGDQSYRFTGGADNCAANNC